jgi:hypothetical protein
MTKPWSSVIEAIDQVIWEVRETRNVLKKLRQQFKQDCKEQREAMAKDFEAYQK